MGRTRGGCAQVVEHEVAPGHSIDRVHDELLEPQLARHRHAIGVEVHPRQRARAQRQPRRLPLGEREAAAVAREHPEVRQQVMAQVHRLRALEVRVSRQRPVRVLLGACQQRRHERAEQAQGLPGALARVHRHVRCDLVVARTRGVQALSRRAGDLRDAPLDRRVDVLVLCAEAEAILAQLLLDHIEAGQQRVAVGPLHHSALRQHAHVRARLRDVLSP